MPNFYSVRQLSIKGFSQEEVIDEASGTGASGVLTFSNIPQRFRNLRITLFGRGDGAGGFHSAFLNYNGDNTSTNYNHIRLLAYSGGVIQQEILGTNQGNIIGAFPGVSGDAGLHGFCDIYIPNYSNSSVLKILKSQSCSYRTASTSGDLSVDYINGNWENTAAVSSITLTLQTGNWTTTTKATLYGQLI